MNLNRACAFIPLYFCAMLVPVADAQAQYIYTCRDASGRVLTADRLIPECDNRHVRVLSRSGILVREIHPPLTPEQQRAKEIEDRKRFEQEEALREAKRRDRALLSSYANVEAIETARRRALTEANETIAQARQRLAALEKEQVANKMEAAGHPAGKVPYVLQRKIEDVEHAMSIDRRLIAERTAEIGRVNQRYDAEKRRYIELTADTQPTSSTSPATATGR